MTKEQNLDVVARGAPPMTSAIKASRSPNLRAVPTTTRDSTASSLRIADAADGAGYTVFAASLRKTDHKRVLASAGPFTAFAPTDAAFEKFAPAVLHKLLNGDPDLLRLVLGYHFARGKVSGSRLAGKRIRAVMYAGGSVVIDGRVGLRANQANVVQADIPAANGVIHGIDTLLWPEGTPLPAGVMAEV